MIRTLICLIAFGTASALHAYPPAQSAGSEELQKQLESDVVLRALVDELGRSTEKLSLEDLAAPYFIEYGLSDAAMGSVSADLGAVTDRSEVRPRFLRVTVRVGSYELDNTNFSGGGGGFYFGGFGGSGRATLPIEDDYLALRQAIWWATDREYKDAVETFEKKKAFMKTKLIEDKPDDFSREEPSVYFEDKEGTSVSIQPMEDLAVALSAVFREFPDIRDSGVSVSGGTGNQYVVNSEGTRVRQAGTMYSVNVTATTQADDGMQITNSFEAHARKWEELPGQEALAEQCRELASTLIAAGKAPVLESYTGPVLFSPAAAASIFQNQMARRFAGGQRSVGSRTSPNDFENKLNKRILPRFMDVVDDPTIEEIDGELVLGHYDYDEQGVKAQRVPLVEDGRLKALVMSRNPSKDFDHSNGHGRGSYGVSASPACLIISVDDGLSEEELREELLEAAADEDLEFGIRIDSLGRVGGGSGRSSYFGRRFGSGGGGSSPTLMYKVYADGREELVRGAQISGLDLKTFKRMLAAGKKRHVLNASGGGMGLTVVAPAMLFEELDLTEIDQDFDTPPILENPLIRE